MQISDVASITRDVIGKHGFEDYHPTVMFPDRRIVRSLAGVPDSADHEQVALQWAFELSEPPEQYFVVFRHSGTEFKVVHMYEDQRKTEVFLVETKAVHGINTSVALFHAKKTEFHSQKSSPAHRRDQRKNVPWRKTSR